MATKKTVKAPVVAAKRSYTRKSKELVSHVISKRTKLFLWTPIEVYADYEAAANAKRAYEASSPLSIDGYKIDKVNVIKKA